MVRAPSVLGVSLVIAGALGACTTDESTFTSEEMDLLKAYQLPAVPPNPSNRVADDSSAAVLGKKFFFDTRFSGALGPANDGATNGSLGMAGTVGKVSCYSCHQLEVGGADRRSRPLATSLGANYGLRNSPTVINVAYSDVTQGGWQLWDGRKDSLWAQALGPMEGPNEHAGTRLQYAHIVFDHYRAEYENAFNTTMPDLSDTVQFPPTGKPGQPAFEGMTADNKKAVNRIYSNIGKAIEAFERRLVSTNFDPSPFDKMLAGDESAMTPGAIRGARLFIGKAACNECHRGPMFSDGKFHNIGCPQTGQNVPSVDVGRTKGIGTVKGDLFNRSKEYSDMADESHLVNLMEQAIDEGAFKTPSLRNVEKTAPYMHDGVYTTMWDVVAHYNFGGGTGTYSGKKESAVSPLNLTDREMDDLVEFLRSLSDGAPLGMDIFPEGLLAAPVLPE